MKKIVVVMLLVGYQVLQAIDVILESKDGKKFKVAQEQVEKSVTLKNILDDLKGQDFSKGSIPLPTIDGDTLRAIVDCLKNPESVDRVVRGLDKDKSDKFNEVVIYLDIQEIFKKIPAVSWLAEQLEEREFHILKGGGGFILALSPDSTFYISGSPNGAASIRNIDGTERAKLNGQGDSAVSISSDGQIIATGSQDGTVKLWDKNGKEKKMLRGHSGPVWSVLIGSDGKIVSNSWDGTERIWKADGTQIAVSKCQGDSIIAGSPNGRLMAIGSRDGTVHIRNMEGAEKAMLNVHDKPVCSVTVSSDNKFIVAGSDDGTVLKLKIDGAEKIILNEGGSRACAVAISPDNTFVVAGLDNGSVLKLKIDGTEKVVLKKSGSKIRAVAISRDGERIVAAAGDGAMLIWNVDNKNDINGLFAEQINLIARIYELARKNEKLDLAQKRADTLKVLTQKKIDMTIFNQLPESIKAALKKFVILP